MNLEKNKKDRRNAIIITSVVHSILLILFIFFGLGYEEPKPRNGYVINFGNSEDGFGELFDGAKSSQQLSPQPPVQSEKVESENPNDQTVRTQDFTDAAEVNSQSSQKIESNNVDKQKPEDVKPKPSDNLTKLLENVDATKGGQGDKQGSGDQGRPEGDPNSLSQVGDGGAGQNGDGNYRLKNRKVIYKGDNSYPCEDEGRVVVKILVDPKGKVIRATPGVKSDNGVASTTTSDCLFDLARSKAMKTLWQADGGAPDLQKGYIIYNFYKS